MHSPHRQQPCALQYIPDNSGLEEFDAESGESRLPSPPARLCRERRNFGSSVSSNNTNPATGHG